MEPPENLPNIPLGRSIKIPHKGCSNSPAMVVTNGVDGFVCYCHKCGETCFISHCNSLHERKVKQALLDAERELTQSHSLALPVDFTHTIAPKGLAWLGKGGWTCDLIKAYGVGWSDTLQRVIIPLDQGFIARAVYPGHEPKYLEKTPPDAIWESHGCNQLGTDWGVITEDVLSAGRVGVFLPAYSLCGTHLSTTQLGVLCRRKKLIVWLDDDKAGTKGIVKAIPRLQLFSTVHVIRHMPEPKHLDNKNLMQVLKGVVCS